MFLSKAANPSCLYPFTSSVSWYPACCTASNHARNSGLVAGPRSSTSGPSEPWNASLGVPGAARQFSIRLKYGRQCA